MRKIAFFLSVLVLGSFLCSGCGKSPQQEQPAVSGLASAPEAAVLPELEQNKVAPNPAVLNKPEEPAFESVPDEQEPKPAEDESQPPPGD